VAGKYNFFMLHAFLSACFVTTGLKQTNIRTFGYNNEKFSLGYAEINKCGNIAFPSLLTM